MKKETKVVMLPTEKAPLVIRHDKPSVIMLSKDSPFTTNETHTYQHLYFLSDKKPKSNDWVYHKDSNTIFQFDLKKEIDFSSYQKIIATTDPNLNLPRPSNEFLQKYCELGGISIVLVEYFEYASAVAGGNPTKFIPLYRLKVAPDNTISIYPIKS
jgi:hypothetical protein